MQELHMHASLHMHTGTGMPPDAPPSMHRLVLDSHPTAQNQHASAMHTVGMVLIVCDSVHYDATKSCTSLAVDRT